MYEVVVVEDLIQHVRVRLHARNRAAQWDEAQIHQRGRGGADQNDVAFDCFVRDLAGENFPGGDGSRLPSSRPSNPDLSFARRRYAVRSESYLLDAGAALFRGNDEIGGRADGDAQGL